MGKKQGEPDEAAQLIRNGARPHGNRVPQRSETFKAQNGSSAQRALLETAKHNKVGDRGGETEGNATGGGWMHWNNERLLFQPIHPITSISRWHSDWVSSSIKTAPGGGGGGAAGLPPAPSTSWTLGNIYSAAQGNPTAKSFAAHMRHIF